MKNLILTLIITLPLTLWGQGWEQTYGGNGENLDNGKSVEQTQDEGYIITGYTNSFGNGGYDVYLIKTVENGNEQWSQTFGGEGTDIGYSVQQINDGGYIITGYTNSFGNGNTDVYLVKTDENGNEQWTKTFGGVSGEIGQSVQQTTDGEYIITGSTESFGNGNSDIYLIKTDGDGNEQWTKTFGGVDNEFGYSIQQTTDGGYIITGSTRSFGNGDNDIYLIKTDSQGDSIWTKTFGGVSGEIGQSVQQTTDGGYIITGFTYSFGNGSTDVYLIKTDENGTELWSQTFGGDGGDEGRSIQQTTDGGYIITGDFHLTDSLSNSDIYLIKTDGNGNELWTKTFGGLPSDNGYDVKQTLDGGYIITGSKGYPFMNNIWFNVVLIKTDDQGNITSTFEIPLPNTNRKLEKTVNIIGQEIKPQTNTPIIEIFDDGSVEKKLIIEK